jgi:signal transduction histidine kinase
MAETSQAVATTQAPPALLPSLAAEAWDDGPVARRAARGRRVARDLVELSRLQRGVEAPTPETIDLSRLVRAICAYYPHVEITGAERLQRTADSRRLARVLTLLLDNACLHGAAPISVGYDACQISVADAGPGFESRLLARATEPFVTGSRARGRGVGLGLAIAARQAVLLGAELRLGNAIDGGAVARLCFVAQAPVAAGIAAA